LPKTLILCIGSLSECDSNSRTVTVARLPNRLSGHRPATRTIYDLGDDQPESSRNGIGFFPRPDHKNEAIVE
jgi:hypothetical protein